MPKLDLLEAVLDSWDRNNTILVNLLRAIPDGMMDLKPDPTSPSIGQLFFHMHYCRLVFVEEAAPDCAREVPKFEWAATPPDRERLAAMLNDSAVVMREAVRTRLESGRPMELHYDHPLLMLQHFVWHEGYHHGQIKLALKLAGKPFDDEEIGDVTWDEWMKKGRGRARD